LDLWREELLVNFKLLGGGLQRILKPDTLGRPLSSAIDAYYKTARRATGPGIGSASYRRGHMCNDITTITAKPVSSLLAVDIHGFP
jgi:hypothetical protein